MKKLTALILIFVMLVSVLPVYASKTAEQEFVTENFKNEIIISHNDAEKTGKWVETGAVKNYDGGNTLWANGKGHSITYNFTDIKPGNYELYNWVCPHNLNAPTIEGVIKCKDGEIRVAQHQKTDEGETVAPGWVSMGVFAFTGKDGENVTFTTKNETVRTSAVKLVPTDKEVTVLVSNNISAENAYSHEIEAEIGGKITWTEGWEYSSSLKNPTLSAPDSLWIAGKGEEAQVNYYPLFNTPCKAKITVYMLYWSKNQTDKIKYEVFHNGKTDEFYLNPLDYTENTWVTLGEFDFSGNAETEFLRVSCVKNENDILNTRASTVVFEVLGEKPNYIYISPHYDDAKVLENAINKYNEQWEMVVPLDKFSDMKDHWAHYDVEYMANEGLIAGKSEVCFDPDANITRAEYITILDRAMGYEIVNGESYADVSNDAWYAPYISTAKNNGLLNGLPADDGFKPEQPITREEMALFTYNAIKATKRNDEWVSKLPTDFAKFTDTAEISDYAKGALEYLIQTGIIKGMTDTTVAPKGNATRAQGAVILKRFMQFFVWAGPPTDQEWVMTFNDEFSGDSLDWGTWRSEASAPGHILSSRWPENIVVKDGDLRLEIRKEEREGSSWTAGSVWVRPEVFGQAYGYWEARYKIAKGHSINNAFWTITSLAPQAKTTTDQFELDINEGHYPNAVNMTLHSFETGKIVSTGQTYYSEYDLSVDYHTYGLLWTKDTLYFYFDGEVKATMPSKNAHLRQFPYLSSAVLNKVFAVSDESDGTAQVIDYVRVWQKKDDVNNPELTFIGKPLENVGPSDAGPSSGKKPEVSNNPGIETTEVFTKDQIVDNKKYKGEIIIAPVLSDDAWQESAAIKNHDGGNHKWIKAKGAKISFPLKDIPEGKYKIYMWRLPHAFNGAQMDMILFQNGEKTLAGSLAVKPEEGETAEPGWILIGEHTLSGDKDADISFTSTGDTIRASAIKLVPVK